MKPYEEVKPSVKEIYDVMRMAREAFEEWKRVHSITDKSVRHVFYQGFYLGYLVGKAKS